MFGLGIIETLLFIIIPALAFFLFRVLSTRYQNQTEVEDRKIRKLAFGWGNFWILLGFISGSSSGGVILLTLTGAFGQPIKPVGIEYIALLLVISVLAIGSAVGLSIRKRFGLYLVYVTLVLLLLGSVVALSEETVREQLPGIVGLITVPLWFQYFRKRRHWFMNAPPLRQKWFPSKSEAILAVSWLTLLIFTLITASNETIAAWGAIVLFGLTVIGLFWWFQSLWRAGNQRGVVGFLGFVTAAIVMMFFLTGGDIEKATTRVGLGLMAGGFLWCTGCIWTAAREWLKKGRD